MKGNGKMKSKIILERVMYLSLLLSISFVLFYFGCSKAPKLYKVGVICGIDYFYNTVDGFKNEMTELGYIEGKNIVYDIQRSRSDTNLAKKILKKFVNNKVDLIFTMPTEVSVVAKEIVSGKNIPIVFANANVEGQQLINSIKEPGNNLTGVRYPGPDLTLKRFVLMLELFPKCKRIWIPYLRNQTIVINQLDILRPFANKKGVTLIEFPANNASEIQKALSTHSKNAHVDFDAILLIPEPLSVTDTTFLIIAKFASNHRIPLGGSIMSAGGFSTLFGVSTENISVGKQSALIADKIFKGIPAGTIPVLSAENYIQINYKEAKKLGIKIPEGLLKQANEIIK
jgi:putative tryptophan/tyrosine transport system substrate-binding protein